MISGNSEITFSERVAENAVEVLDQLFFNVPISTKCSKLENFKTYQSYFLKELSSLCDCA